MYLDFPQSDLAYFVFAFLGSCFAYLAARLTPNQPPLASQVLLPYYLLVFSAALLGAYSVGPLTLLLGSAYEPGKSLIMAMFFGWLGAEIVKNQLGIVGSTGDQLALAIPAGLSISRLGCLFGHCCYGTEYHGPLALIDSGTLHFPIPLLEVAFHTVFFALALYSQRAQIWQGQRLRLYFIAYCVFRFVSEYWRLTPKDLAGFSIYQWFSLFLLALVVATMLFEQSKAAQAAERPV